MNTNIYLMINIYQHFHNLNLILIFLIIIIFKYNLLKKYNYIKLIINFVNV